MSEAADKQGRTVAAHAADPSPRPVAVPAAPSESAAGINPLYATDSPWRESLVELAARLAADAAGAPELAAWAAEALGHGLDSPALRRLAGIYPHETRSDALPWLKRCLAELGLQLPEGDALRSDYAALLARRVLRGQSDPAAALARLSALNYARGQWDPLLQPICDLQAAAELQPDELPSYTWLYADFGSLPLSELIAEECRLYLALAGLAPPADLLATAWCLSCGQRAIPRELPKQESWSERAWRILAGNPREHQNHCPGCNSTALLPLTTLAGRRRYLEESSDHPAAGMA